MSAPQQSPVETKGVEPSVSQHEEKGETNVEAVTSNKQAIGHAINPLLIFSCITVGASSMLFGYDDKVISPIAALEPFVSLLLARVCCLQTSNSLL